MFQGRQNGESVSSVFMNWFHMKNCRLGATTPRKFPRVIALQRTRNLNKLKITRVRTVILIEISFTGRVPSSVLIVILFSLFTKIN